MPFDTQIIDAAAPPWQRVPPELGKILNGRDEFRRRKATTP